MTSPTTPTQGSLSLLHPQRGAKGRFSNLAKLFEQAGLATLKKFGLYDEHNASEVLATLFSTRNFGYGKDELPQTKKTRRSPPATFGVPGTADSPTGNSSPANGHPT